MTKTFPCVSDLNTAFFVLLINFCHSRKMSLRTPPKLSSYGGCTNLLQTSGLFQLPSPIYRVYHIEMVETKWLWGLEESIILLNYDAQWLQEVWTFEFYQPVFIKVTSAGLNSLRKKKVPDISKKWIFDDPFQKKGTGFGHLGGRHTEVSMGF